MRSLQRWQDHKARPIRRVREGKDESPSEEASGIDPASHTEKLQALPHIRHHLPSVSGAKLRHCSAVDLFTQT